MADHAKGQSDALRAAAAKRLRLKQAVSQVEIAAAAPSADAGWRARLLRELEDLEAALLQHVEEVEAPDGLLAEMTAKSPRLVNHIAQVRDAHPELCRHVAQTIRSAKSSSEIDDLRAEVLETLIAIARHRQKGADLVYEGYDVDIGG